LAALGHMTEPCQPHSSPHPVGAKQVHRRERVGVLSSWDCFKHQSLGKIQVKCQRFRKKSSSILTPWSIQAHLDTAPRCRRKLYSW
jgi:hypothetical protein